MAFSPCASLPLEKIRVYQLVVPAPTMDASSSYRMIWLDGCSSLRMTCQMLLSSRTIYQQWPRIIFLFLLEVVACDAGYYVPVSHILMVLAPFYFGIFVSCLVSLKSEMCIIATLARLSFDSVKSKEILL
jgi:uncharacterized membrane protein AbrB (regulator of aidB expression)